MNKRKLKKILSNSLYAWHEKKHYDYQQRIDEAVIKGLFESMEGKAVEIPIRFPRQSGKTTAVVDIIEFLLANFKRYFGRPLRIGIFAPEKEQATTDFDRLKLQFSEIMSYGFTTRTKSEGDVKFPEKWNSKAIRIYKRKTGDFLGEVYIFPITKTSNPESKTLDLIIIEECQDVNDEKMKNAVFPMGASTNAPRIYIGSAGYKICFFKRELENNPNAVQISLEDVFKERRELARITGDKTHLLYEAFVKSEINKYGKEDPYIRTQYFGEWIIGAGQFTTGEKLDAMVEEGRTEMILENKPEPELDNDGQPKKDGNGDVIMKPALPIYVGIDTAKHVDKTVVKVIRDRADNSPDKPHRSDLIAWLTLKGDNYEDQFDIITDWLKPFEGIKGIGIDATGQGDFMPDKFERHTSYNIIRCKFSVEFKDVIYKILLQVIENKLTTIPNLPMDSSYRQFRQEMLDLEREQKGRFMSVHHPDGQDMHDDHPDAWAIAEYTKTVTMQKEPRLSFM